MPDIDLWIMYLCDTSYDWVLYIPSVDTFEFDTPHQLAQYVLANSDSICDYEYFIEKYIQYFPFLSNPTPWKP